MTNGAKQMTIRIQTTVAAVAAAGLLAAAFSASASAEGGYEQARFKAEVKGVQTYVSEYHHTATDRCDTSVDTVSKETARFKSTKPVLLTATHIPGVKELVLTSGDKPLRIPTKGTVTRSHSNSFTPIPEDCGGNGGGVEPVAPDCGTKVVQPWWMTVDYYKRSHVELQPEDNAGSDLFENCGSGSYPYLLSGESFGRRQSADLPENEVFDEKIGKLITIGKGTESIPMPDGYDETKLRWELSLTRIKGN
jgi:hypothetical protein